jgi:NADPH:quinone reductase-like Zn-dependent oxidoreductase
MLAVRAYVDGWCDELKPEAEFRAREVLGTIVRGTHASKIAKQPVLSEVEGWGLSYDHADKTQWWANPPFKSDWSAMTINVMKSLRFTEFGLPSVLRIKEVPIPEPGEGETLVRVKAAGINPSDIANVSGRFKNTTLPRTPGRDFAGTVAKGRYHEGDEVWGSSPTLGIVRDGSHAEYVVVPAETLSLKPKSLSMAQAAAIGVPYITAWASVVSAAQIKAGETILIVGAAGAVGQAATQIATWKQAHVIGADITSDPIPGTESTVNTKSEDLREKVLELTAGKGVNAVFDTVGGPLFEPALRSLGFGGRQVAIASAGTPRVSFNLVDFYHSFSQLLGVDSYGLTTGQIAEIADELRPGFETGALKPPPIEIVPFEKAVDAYSRMAAGQAKAKQVLSFDWA